MNALKEKILSCLERYPETRNSDIKLTNCIWINFYQEKLMRDALNNWCVRLTTLYDLPREDDVKRLRAKIQNEESKFLPTDPEVRRQRRINEEKWLEYLKNN